MVPGTCGHMVLEFGGCMDHPGAAGFEAANIDAEGGWPACCSSSPQDTTEFQ